MSKFNKILKLSFLSLLLCSYGSLLAVTKTAIFDFSTNSYELPYMESAGGVPNYLKQAQTISENGISITLFDNPCTGDSYRVTWRQDLAALYFPKYQFIVFSAESNSQIKSISMTFDGDNNANGKNFYITNRDNGYTSLSDLPYSFVENIGNIDLSAKQLSSVCWQNNQINKLVIKSITVTYDDGISTGIAEAEQNLYKIIGQKGSISITGDYSTVAVYNIGGVMIAKDQSTVNCPAGIYIVKVDGKANKVIVK